VGDTKAQISKKGKWGRQKPSYIRTDILPAICPPK
jgi:hypothetical protein